MIPFRIELDQIQPSQLYISREKLEPLLQNYTTGDEQALPPVPIKKLDDRLIYTDGHTRSLAAYLNGQQSITAVWDEDELDWEAYQICVEWCLAEDIRTVADLQTRIIEPAKYRVLWLERCQRMQSKLEKQRSKNR